MTTVQVDGAPGMGVHVVADFVFGCQIQGLAEAGECRAPLVVLGFICPIPMSNSAFHGSQSDFSELVFGDRPRFRVPMVQIQTEQHHQRDAARNGEKDRDDEFEET